MQIRNFSMFESIFTGQVEFFECEKTIQAYEILTKYLDNIIGFDEYASNESLYQVCAYQSDKLIGVVVFRMKDDKIHLNYSAVIEDYRNKGINRKMLEKIIEIAKINKISLITANVRISNKASLKSLLNSGLNINNRVSLKYPDGEEKVAFYLKIADLL
jgi:ribosomal protein S18 acetylase RimI-like enzyme